MIKYRPVNGSGNANPREMKIAELSAACQATIFAGIELDGKHYSLTTNDQINIQNLALQIQAGAEAVLYHADGELCGLYTAEAIMALMEAAVRHVTYHTTYCNHLLVWARRAELDELNGIYYGAALPKDLQKNIDTLLAAMGGGGA